MFSFITKNENHKNNKVLILGSANGSGNLGDEAMFEAIALYYYKNYKDVSIVTDASSDDYVSPYSNVTKIFGMYGNVGVKILFRIFEIFCLLVLPKLYICILRNIIKNNSELYSYYQELITCDYLVISGAGAINSQFKGYGIYGWGSIVLLAKTLNKNVYVTGQGIGPFYSKFDKWFALYYLSMAEIVKCRDKKSFELIKHKVPNSFYDLDDATYVENLSPSEFSIIMKKNILKKNFVVVSIHDWYKIDKKSFLDEINDIILKFRSKDLQIVLLGNKIKGKMNDIPFLTMFKNTYFKEDDNVILLTPPYNSIISKSVISYSKCLLTTRYHPAIFAFENKIPTVGIYYDDYYKQKFEGAFMFRNDNDCSIISYSDLSLINNCIYEY